MTWADQGNKEWGIMGILNEWRNELLGTIKWWSNAQPLTTLAEQEKSAEGEKWQKEAKSVVASIHKGDDISVHLVDWEKKRIDKRKHD